MSQMLTKRLRAGAGNIFSASQDEVVRLGTKSDPHGEEAHRAVSNHEAPRRVMTAI
jgi:hypothetical protein